MLLLLAELLPLIGLLGMSLSLLAVGLVLIEWLVLVPLASHHVILRSLIPVHVGVEGASLAELTVGLHLGSAVAVDYLLIVVFFHLSYPFVLDSFLPALFLELERLPALVLVQFHLLFGGLFALLAHRLYEGVVSA